MHGLEGRGPKQYQQQRVVDDAQVRLLEEPAWQDKVCQLATIVLISTERHSPAIAKMCAAQHAHRKRGRISLRCTCIAIPNLCWFHRGRGCSWDAAHLVQTRAHSWNPKKPALTHTSMSGSAPASSLVGLQVMKSAPGHLKMYAEAARKTPAEYTMCTRSTHHHALPSLPSRLHRCTVMSAAMDASKSDYIPLRRGLRQSRACSDVAKAKRHGSELVEGQ